MQITSTIRLYLQDDHCFETNAIVIADQENLIAFDQTCFYPGGGGQPPDNGWFELQDGERLEIVSAYADSDDIIWHVCKTNPLPDLTRQAVRLVLNKNRRLVLMRYHTVLHVLNTITLREYDGWITGVQINEEYSRIDFKVENLSPAMSVELEKKVNVVLSEDHNLSSHYIPEEEFKQRTICCER